MIIPKYAHVYTQISSEAVNIYLIRIPIWPSDEQAQHTAFTRVILKSSFRKYYSQHLTLVIQYTVAHRFHRFFCNALFPSLFSGDTTSTGIAYLSAANELTPSFYFVVRVAASLDFYVLFLLTFIGIFFRFTIALSARHSFAASKYPSNLFFLHFDHCLELHGGSHILEYLYSHPLFEEVSGA